MIAGYADKDDVVFCAECWATRRPSGTRPDRILDTEDPDGKFWIVDKCETCGREVRYQTMRRGPSRCQLHPKGRHGVHQDLACRLTGNGCHQRLRARLSESRARAGLADARLMGRPGDRVVSVPVSSAASQDKTTPASPGGGAARSSGGRGLCQAVLVRYLGSSLAS
jgi:hypothetical protein